MNMPPIVYLVRHGEAQHNIDVSKTINPLLVHTSGNQNLSPQLAPRLYPRCDFNRCWEGAMSQFEKYVPIPWLNLSSFVLATSPSDANDHHRLWTNYCSTRSPVLSHSARTGDQWFQVWHRSSERGTTDKHWRALWEWKCWIRPREDQLRLGRRGMEQESKFSMQRMF